MSIEVGDLVWVPSVEEAWVSGTVVKVSSDKLVVKTDQQLEISVPKKDRALIEKCGHHLLLDVQNLVDLEELSEGAILHHVRKRYKNKYIYTHVGAILVAVNPFERLDIYNKSEMERQRIMHLSNLILMYLLRLLLPLVN